MRLCADWTFQSSGDSFQPLVGVTVSIGELSTQSNPDGTFVLPSVPSAPQLTIRLHTIDGGVRTRDVGPFTPVAGGTTDVGMLVFSTPAAGPPLNHRVAAMQVGTNAISGGLLYQSLELNPARGTFVTMNIHEVAEAYRRVLDLRLREPMRAAARALLARPIEDDQHRQGEGRVLVRCLSAFDLIDLEPEIVRAIRTTTSQRLRTACYDCLASWAARGHESALDRIIENDGDTRGVPPELVMPKVLAELEREQERPWTTHFRWLVGMNYRYAFHSDPERLERVLNRGREILEQLPGGERKETVASRLRNPTEVLADVRQVKGAGGSRD